MKMKRMELCNTKRVRRLDQVQNNSSFGAPAPKRVKASRRSIINAGTGTDRNPLLARIGSSLSGIPSQPFVTFPRSQTAPTPLSTAQGQGHGQGHISQAGSSILDAPLGENQKAQKVKTTKKSVHFAPSATVRLSLHINDFTRKEIESTWHSPSDVKQFKAQCKMLAKAYAFRDIPDIEEEEGVTLRGIEFLIPRLSNNRRLAKVLSLNAVLDEQDRLRKQKQHHQQQHYQQHYQQQLKDSASAQTTNEDEAKVRDIQAERIARVYKENSLHCSVWARKVACEDSRRAYLSSSLSSPSCVRGNNHQFPTTLQPKQNQTFSFHSATQRPNTKLNARLLLSLSSSLRSTK